MIRSPRRVSWQPSVAPQVSVSASNKSSAFSESPQSVSPAIMPPEILPTQGAPDQLDVFVSQAKTAHVAPPTSASGDSGDMFDPAAHHPGHGLPPGIKVSTTTSPPPQPGPMIETLPTAGFAKVNREEAEKLKQEGNRLRGLRQYEKAIETYRKAIALDPKYTDAYYNLARTYDVIGDKPKAIHSLQHLLEIDPDDHDARVTLAGFYEDLNLPQYAKTHYDQVLAREPRYDPALRARQLLDNLILGEVNADKALQDYQTQAAQTLMRAQGLLRPYLTKTHRPDLLQLMDHIRYEYAGTDKVVGSQNLAEYDHSHRVIRLMPSLAYAHPATVAAYLVHEFEHAKDNDNLNSIAEEQDGYLALARYWNTQDQPVVEPNLDLATELMTRGEQQLRDKVRELYLSRDPYMPETSPGHGQSYLSVSEFRTFQPENMAESEGGQPSGPRTTRILPRRFEMTANI
jgi:hypothetical protein